MLHCPNCNKQYESGKFCPECGVPLVEDQSQQTAGMSITLGDANAISGGVHVANTTNVQNTFIQEREKSESELEQEKRIKFKSLCEKVFEDGILENYEIVQLEDERIKLGLDKETANMMIEQARKSSQSTKATLAARDAITMKIINMQIQKNDINQIYAQFPKLEAIHDIYKNDAVDCTYFMLLSTLFPDRLIESYEKSKVDDYWQTFWGYVAYMKALKIDKAEKTLAKLSWFSRYPESNDLLLSALNSNMEFGPDIAKDYLSIVEAEPCSPELTQFYHALLYEIDPEKAASFGINSKDIAYYLDAVVRMEDPREKAAAIAKEQAEKIEQLGKDYMMIVEEYGTSKFGKECFEHLVREVNHEMIEYVGGIGDECGRNSPKYTEANEAYKVFENAKKFNEGDLWTIRKYVNENPIAIKFIDAALERFVESEMLPGRKEIRQQFKQFSVDEKKRMETKAARDEKAPLLGEAFLKIIKLKKEEKGLSVEEQFEQQVKDVESKFESLYNAYEKNRDLAQKYGSASKFVYFARNKGCKNLWDLRKKVDNLLVQEEVDNRLEMIVKKECVDNEEFRKWFEEREKAEAKKKEVEHAKEVEIKLEAERKEKEQIEARKRELELAEAKLEAARKEKEQIEARKKELELAEIKLKEQSEKLEAESKEKDLAEVIKKQEFRITRRINVDDLSDAERDFMSLVKRLKSRLAAKVTANPEDKEARDAYERVKYAYYIFHDSSLDNKRNVATLREMLKDWPLAIEAIEQCAPRFK